MEAIIDKKSPKKTTGRWQSRLFRLKDRRLMHFKKGVLDFTTPTDKSAKRTLDLTYLQSLTIDEKHANVLILKHRDIDLALRFKTEEVFICWLKVLASFTKNIKPNEPNIKTAVPSNYLYSIWNVLQGLYSHPNLLKTEGLFRKSGNKTEQMSLFNDLLHQNYDIQKLQKYEDINVLAKVLCSLLSNLPSTIFKEKQIKVLVQFFDRVKRESKKSVKKGSKKRHVDDDVSGIPMEYISKLKQSIELLYLSSNGDRNRYGLMTLIFHLLKQVIIHEESTKMTAESMSIIFAETFESKIFLNTLTDPMKLSRSQYLIKALIYWAYDVFTEQEWQMKDIVIVEQCELDYLDLYTESHKPKKAPNHKKSKSSQWRDKYLLSKQKVSKKELKLSPQNSLSESKEKELESATPFVSHFKNPSLSNVFAGLNEPSHSDSRGKSEQQTTAAKQQKPTESERKVSDQSAEKAAVPTEQKSEPKPSTDAEQTSKSEDSGQKTEEKTAKQDKSEPTQAKPNKIDEETKQSLQSKMKNRPSWHEVNSRGIVLDSTQTEQKRLHKRNASGTIDKLLLNRPSPNELHSQNIINTKAAVYYGALANKLSEKFSDNIDKESFAAKLQQRPTWNEVNSRGIILDSAQTEQKRLHKRNASEKIDHLLTNRPTWNEVNSRGIVLDSAQTEQKKSHKRNASDKVANLLMNRPSMNEITALGILWGEADSDQRILHRRKASDTVDKLLLNRPSATALYAHNIIGADSALEFGVSEAEIHSDKMDMTLFHNKFLFEKKLRQRPSMGETVARGILLDRTDGKLNYDLQRRHKELHRRKASQTIESFMQKRPSKSELKQRNIWVTNDGMEQKRKHKRQTSLDLEAGLKKRMNTLSRPRMNDSESLNIYRDMVKLFEMMYNVRTVLKV